MVALALSYTPLLADDNLPTLQYAGGMEDSNSGLSLSFEGKTWEVGELTDLRKQSIYLYMSAKTEAYLTKHPVLREGMQETELEELIIDFMFSDDFSNFYIPGFNRSYY